MVVVAESGGDDHLRCDFRKRARLLAPMWRALGREFWTPGEGSVGGSWGGR